MICRLSPEREAEIRRSIPDSFRAPWHWQPTDEMDGWEVLYATDHPLAGLVATVPGYGENLACFIAEARTAVPELLAELAAVRAERDEAQAEAERLKRQCSFLLKQIQKKDARSGEADAALRRFLSDDEGAAS